jgi:hypothetical protein
LSFFFPYYYQLTGNTLPFILEKSSKKILDLKKRPIKISPDKISPDTFFNIESIKKKAVSQLGRYCLDEKFQKAIGKTNLVKVILVFSGHRLVYREEVD